MLKILHAHNHGHKNIGDDSMANCIFRSLSGFGGEVWTISTYTPPEGQDPCRDICSLSKIINNYDSLVQKAFLVACYKMKLRVLHRLYARTWCAYAVFAARIYNRVGFVPTISRKLKKLITAIEWADLYVRSGSGSLNDIWFHSSMLPQMTEVTICKVFGTKVVFTGQGIGPLSGELRRQAFRDLLSNCDYMTFRDRYFSERLALELGVDPNRFESVGDDAFFQHKQEYSGTLPKRNYIVCQLRPTDYEQRIEGTVWERFAEALKLARHASREKFDVIFLSFSSGKTDDLSPARTVQKLVSEPWISVIEEDLTPAQARGVIGGASMAIGQSYHFGVFALAESVPFIAVFNNTYYEQKMKGLLDWYDRNRFAISTNALEQLSGLILEIEDRLEEEEASLRQTNERLAEQLRLAWDRVRSIQKGLDG